MNDSDRLCRRLIEAYKKGLFPMSGEEHGPYGFSLYESSVRSLLPIDMHVSRSLRKLLKKNPFEIETDLNFAGVIDGCAVPRKPGEKTWINHGLRSVMIELYKRGYAHSVECWRDGRLVGGVYGVAVGQVFCAESMFSAEPNASKVALVHLCARLKAGGFKLLDTQYINDHVRQFGAYEMPQAAYVKLIAPLVKQPSDFDAAGKAYATPAAMLDAYFASRSAKDTGQKLNNLVI